jgi:type II secretory pathway component PulF
MPEYKYRAKKGPVDMVEGLIEAVTEEEAIEKISQLGLLPVHLEPRVSDDSQKAAVSRGYSGRVRPREITLFSRQLSSLLKSGIPILTALDIIAEQSESSNLKNILGEIKDKVRSGSTLSSALAAYSRTFSALYVAMVHTGEDSGALPETLLKISEYRAKQEIMRARFRMAMAYPIMMAMVGIGTIVFMLTFVMPRLMRIFVNMGQSLPIPTKILIAISATLQQRWPLIILVIGIVFIVLNRQSKTQIGKLSFSILKLRLPVIGKLVLKTELAQFTNTLGLLIRSGIPVLKAIDVSIPVLGNEVIKIQLRQSYKDLEQGGSFGRSLKSSKLLPPFIANLIIVGEESGRLSEALAEITDTYEREVDEAMKTAANLLEPITILVMGLIVGFIVIAMLLPIFEINVMAR